MNAIIKKNGVTFGILTGLFSVLITTFIYIINLELFISAWLGIATLVMYIAIGVFLLSKTKKELQNIFSFKDAFTTYFISAVIGILISVAFNIILFNYVDPDSKETIKDLSINYTTEMLKKFGTPASAINQAIAEMEKTDQFSISSLLKSSVTYMLFAAVFGLILAAIFKSKSTYQEL